LIIDLSPNKGADNTKLLDQFIAYPEQRGTDTVTVADALA
jgi:hypothetical protein